MKVHHRDNQLTWVTYHVLIGVDSLELKHLSLLAKSHSSLGGEVGALVKKDVQ